MNNYYNGILYALEQIKIEGLKHFRPEKSIITQYSKEVSIVDKSNIRIAPTDNCLAITIRGRNQSIHRKLSEKEMEWLKEDFNFFISNDKKDNGETYDQFIKRRLNTISEYNPHIMCLYIEDSEGELRDGDKIHISLAYKSNVNDIYEKLDRLHGGKFTTLVRYFYNDFEEPFAFDAGIMIKNNENKKSLEITAFRGKDLIEINNFKLYLECDRWYKAMV